MRSILVHARPALLFAASLALVVACGRQAAPPDPSDLASSAVPDIVINEVRIDQSGSDVDEFFELAGPSGTSLDGLAYLVIGDDASGTATGSGVIDAVVDLAGQAIPTSGYFVAAESTFTLGAVDLVTNLNFENGDNVTHLLVAGFTGQPGDDLDANDDGVLDTEPWATELDRIALVVQENPPSTTEYHYGPPSVGPDGAYLPSHVFRCGDAWLIGEFTSGSDTPGAANPCSEPPPPLVCGAGATPISAIQGADMASPLDGDVVEIEAIVVGDFQANDGDAFGTDLGGFFVQEEDADRDSDAVTSEGVFVYAPGSTDVDVGDVVRLEGDVSEFYGMTQVSNVRLLVCAEGTTLPAAAEIAFPLASLDALEAFEGMYVTVPQPLFISEFFDFDRYGEVVLAASIDPFGRHFQPTSYVEPAAAPTEAAKIALNRITLDDGRGNQNPDPARHPNGNVFDLDNRFRGGDTVTNVTGVLNYAFGAYKIQPTEGADHAASNPRPSTPDAVGGNVTVASLNVLNYFTTLGSRGADTPDEFKRQRAKIFAALAGLDADVVGLMEIENAAAALTDLVSGLNDEVGAGTYQAIETGPIGPDEIRVALIYKPATVTPVGDVAVLATPEFLDPNDTGEARNRPALAQTFEPAGGGDAVTVVVNHLKSKGSGCGPGDDDPRQGNCNLTRTLAAQELLDWLATDPTGSGDPDVLLIGDYNAYDEEDPVDLLLAGGYGDLLEGFRGEDAYTYVFDGQLGYLDYALANSILAGRVTGATAWAINADEPDILDYDTSFKQPAQDALYEPNAFRSSDHDPVLVGLDLSNFTPVCDDAHADVGRMWPANHQLVAGAISGVTDPDGDSVTVVIDSIYQDEPIDADDDGDTIPDGVIGVGNDFEVRAERDGEGNGRVYHVSFTADDGVASCTGTVQIAVDVNQGRNGAAIDDGPLYDATAD